MTEDWEWWNWLLFVAGMAATSALCEWNLRKHEKKRQKFYGMRVAIDDTVKLIDWTIDRWALRWMRNMTASLSFCFACWWAYRAIFGGE